MLEVKNLVKSFGKNTILNGIDFKLEKGDRVAIIGPSGCGKSTLLRCINKLEVANSGEIIFEDKNLLDKNTNLEKMREKIGMVFQQFNLFPHLTVLDNIILAPIELKLMTKEEAIKKAEELLESIGLLDKKDMYPTQISGGQQQRVAIVRSLIMNPDIMLFDEPTSALDPEMVNEVLDMIMDIANKGMSMMIVSHEMNFVKKVSNKILFIEDGKVVYFGPTKEAYSDETNERLKDFLRRTSK